MKSLKYLFCPNIYSFSSNFRYDPNALKYLLANPMFYLFIY